MPSAIEGAVGKLLDMNLRVLSLGGDHAVTFPILRAFARKYPKLSILHFDAHPDIYDEFEGNRFSHACPFARIMEEKLVQRLVQVGIRTATAHQRAQIARFGVESIEMKDFRDDLALEFDGPVYVIVRHRRPRSGVCAGRVALGAGRALDAPGARRDRAREGADRRRRRGGVQSEGGPVGLTAMVCAKLVKELAGKMLEGG